MITPERIKELFEYHSDGFLIKKSTGEVVVCSETKGQRYLRILVDGKPRPLHRMIFMLLNGYIPKIIDHIDGNKLNNKIENLREVSQQQNCLNRKHHKNSKSPYKNVMWNESAKKWAVTMQVNGKRKYFGVFEDIEFAELVAIEARNKYHGQYARHF
jgi:hypothetical protein